MVLHGGISSEKGNAVTYNEVFEAFKTLTPAEKQRLLDAGRQYVHASNLNLLTGAKVQFKTQYGVFIAGTMVRMKRKNAEVHSLFDRYGIKPDRVVRWNVALELLIPIPADQVRMYEFP